MSTATAASTAASKATPLPGGGWRNRVGALRNIPPLFRMVWESAPRAVSASLALRFAAALLPLALLAVTRLIIDAIDAFRAHQVPLPLHFWWWVALEFALAGMGALLGRSLDFCDTVLADKYTRYISTKTMEHACQLDLVRYEDPVFLRQARTSARPGHRPPGNDPGQRPAGAGDHHCGEPCAPAFICFRRGSSGRWWFAWCPLSSGEAHFAFLRYALNFEQTPARREMDYLRILGGSKEGAKELKLFGLAPFLLGRYVKLSDHLHNENVHLGKKKLFAGALLILLSTAGYYGAYAYAVYQTVAGAISPGHLDLPHRRDRRRQHQHPGDVHLAFGNRRPSRFSRATCWTFSPWSQ